MSQSRVSTARAGTLVAAALTAALVPLSCVERKERFTVYENGLVEIELRSSSPSTEELDGPDPLPDAFSGWLVEESQREDDEGRTVHVRTARNAFAPDDPLPETWAAPGDVREASALRFPTTITIEDRRDGTWYHFRRVYPPRSWAPLQHLRERTIDPVVAPLEGREPAALAPEERTAVARGLASHEVERTLLFGRRAFVETTPQRGQDGWLLVESDLRALPDEVALDAAAVLFPAEGETPAMEAARLQAMEDAVVQFREQVRDRLRLALRRDASYGGREITEFERSLDEHAATAAVTEDLSDDAFEITVELPGAIMATNGAVAADGRSATWSFTGEDLRDRGLELLVSSRLPPAR